MTHEKGILTDRIRIAGGALILAVGVVVSPIQVLAAPTPDFRLGEPPVGSSDALPDNRIPPVQVRPMVPGKAALPAAGNASPAAAVNSSGNDIPLPDLSAPAAPEESPAGPGGVYSTGAVSNVSGVYQGLPDKDQKYMETLIDLRKRIIKDLLEKRVLTLEGKTGFKFPALPGSATSKPTADEVLKARLAALSAKKKAAEINPGIKVLGIHEDRVLVSYAGKTRWIVLGSTIMGKYRLSGVTDKTATFEGPKHEKIVLNVAPKVIPRPEIAVKSVENQTATIVYRGAPYTVTLNSPIGDDLTVTGLSSTNFSVTDAHGRVFSYPVPQLPVAQNPGQSRFSPPPFYGGPGAQGPTSYPGNSPGVGAAEDSNY